MQFAEATFGRAALADEMKAAIEEAEGPSPLLRLLARLPIATWLTTNYDLMIERALREAGRGAQVLPFPLRSYWEPSAVKPAVLKLHGDVTAPPHLVLTEDDFVEFVQELSFSENASAVRKLMGEGCVLLLGWNYRSVENRLMLRFLLPKRNDDLFVVYPTADPLMRAWQEQRTLRLIEDDLWSFIPNLYEAVERRGGIM
jgi:hypothetical protein